MSKIRLGFVSNSSSSSFIVSLKDISAFDLKKILEYPDLDTSDSWTIGVDDDNNTLHGFTVMNNGDINDYLKKHNINAGKFQWEYD